MCTILLGYIVEKMGADPSGKFDKDWRRINLTVALRPGTGWQGGGQQPIHPSRKISLPDI